MERRVGRTDWESELRRLASGEADITLPNAREIAAALNEINTALGGATNDGLQGTAAEAAVTAFGEDARDALILKDDVTRIMTAVDGANAQRQATAQRYVDDLDSGFPDKLEWWQEGLLRAATIGSTWTLGPFSFVVSEGVVGTVNDLLASQRSARAREGVQAVSAAMDAEAANLGGQPRIASKSAQNTESWPPPGEGDPGVGGPDTTGPGGSFGTYPGANDNPGVDLPPGVTYDPPRDDNDDDFPGTNPTFPNDPNYPEPPVCPPGPGGDGPGGPDDNGSWDPDDNGSWNPDDNGPWGPDGPRNPDPNGYLPDGYDPNDPSTWGGRGPNGALTPDSSMGGGSHGWGTGTTRVGGGLGVGGLGGSGSTSLGGLGGGAGSAALLGGAGGAVSLAGAKLMQTGGPGLGGGLLGSSGAGSAAGAGAAGGRAGGAMGMMGGGAAGGAAEKKSRPGLAGLRAPQLDGDEDPTPRSEAAGAGGRDI